jgi:outer membrane protein assembly factor BamB
LTGLAGAAYAAWMTTRRVYAIVAAALLAGALATSRAELAGGSVAMVEPEGEAQAYWPRWRGPSGQGLARGEGYPDTWSETENVAWRTAVPGRGHSSPIVWKDRIFLTTSYDDDGRAAILAFRRGDGKLLWQAFGPDTTHEKRHRKNSSASATPVTDGKRVYAFFGHKGLLAVGLDGKRRWHRSLGTFANYHGTAGSPLLYKDRLILFQDHKGTADGTAFIAAFDAADGRPRWRTEREGTVGWGTPVAVRAGGRDEIVVNGQHHVTAYDPETGRELWRAGGNTSEVIPTPVVGHGLVFCSSGRAGPTLAVRPGGRGDVTETHVAWKAAKGSPFVPSPVLYGDYLYMVNDMASVATCYRATTGAVVWQGRLGEARREGFSASPVAADGKVFFTNDGGETFVLKAGPEFEVLRVNRLGAPVLASPALVDGRIYFRSDRELIAIGR